MKVLWISNVLFPDVCQMLGIEAPATAGWVHSAAKSLLTENENIQLAVATLYNGKELKCMYINKISYFLVPNEWKIEKYETNLETYWKSVHSQFCPDIVHIHGTEIPSGLAYIRACGNKHLVVSIQGLVSIYQKYYYGGISRLSLCKNITFRDLISFDSIFRQRNNMYRRGLWEKNTLENTNHIIGRTSWDKAHAWAVNPTVNYHFCNETLRTAFYHHKWELENCEKHTIFLSQAYYPIKGLQQLILSLPIILKQYPDTKVIVSGENFFTNRGFRLHGFGKYIRGLMKKNNVFDKVVFTGVLSEKEMCNFYLRSHVFVCPSAIENSSNSICEAQLLGVPCVASYVGGVSDLITNEETGILYRYEEIEMLAAAVCKVFTEDVFARELSKNEREVALIRHNKQINACQLNSIYKKVLEL